jgi:hypothetical protein
VGVEHSIPMRDTNYCLDEYLEFAQPDPSDFLVEDLEEDIDFEDLIPQS